MAKFRKLKAKSPFMLPPNSFTLKIFLPYTGQRSFNKRLWLEKSAFIHINFLLLMRASWVRFPHDNFIF